jgi:hypothetical protein
MLTQVVARSQPAQVVGCHLVSQGNDTIVTTVDLSFVMHAVPKGPQRQHWPPTQASSIGFVTPALIS